MTGKRYGPRAYYQEIQKDLPDLEIRKGDYVLVDPDAPLEAGRLALAEMFVGTRLYGGAVGRLVASRRDGYGRFVPKGSPASFRMKSGLTWGANEVGSGIVKLTRIVGVQRNF